MRRTLLADARWVDGIDDDRSVSEDPVSMFPDDLVGWNFRSDKTLAPNNASDEHGHGTHIAGIVGAEGNNDEGVVGVNWAASILPLKFLGRSNTGSVDDAITALNYVTMLRAGGARIQVANTSWVSEDNPLLRDAVRAAGEQEILVVSGAGNGDVFRQPNNNDQSPLYPASFELENVVGVTATNPDDELVSSFNFGPKSIDVAAPGLGIRSTDIGGEYTTRSGTSFATAFVSGAAALVAANLPAGCNGHADQGCAAYLSRRTPQPRRTRLHSRAAESCRRAGRRQLCSHSHGGERARS